MVKIVLDTNVLVSAMLKQGSPPAIILALILNKKVKLFTSREIFKEYEEVLARPKFRALDKVAVKKLLLALRKISTPMKPAKGILQGVSLPDADDVIFIACAYEARADCIVTGNIKDFTGVSSVKVLTPREFLVSIAAKFFG